MATVGAQPDPLTPGSVVGPYRLLELVGEGGQAQVWRAWDDRLKRTVAIKAPRALLQPDPTTRRNSVRELRLACTVKHPYVATVLDVVELDAQVLLVMEHIEGDSLDRWLARERPGLETVLQLASEITEALRAIHRAGLVHRDLKPSNVMLTPDGHVKVMDFGLALRVRPAEPVSGVEQSDSTLTEQGRGAGTLGYMAPEQVRGEIADARSDLFSFGVLLYELLTGEHPFRRRTKLEMLTAALHDPPGGGREHDSLTRSGPLREVVLRLLEKDPGSRYQDAEKLLEDLRHIRRGDAPSPHDAPRASFRRAHRTQAVVAALAIVAVAGVLWILRGTPTSSARPLLAVLPLQDLTGEVDGDERGRMIADLLASQLGSSKDLRVADRERVTEILAGVGPGLGSAILKRLAAALPVHFVVSGTLYRDQTGYQAALDLREPGQEAPQSFRVAAASPMAIADLAAVRIRELLGFDPEPSAGSTPRSEAALLLQVRARGALRQSRLGDAINLLEQSLQIEPEDAEALGALAEARELAGYGRRARETAERALRLVQTAGRPESDRTMLRVRAIHARVNGADVDELAARRALAERYPDEPGLLLALAEALGRQRGNPDEARSALDRAAALDAHDPRIHLERWRQLAREGRPDDAQRALEAAEDEFEAIGGPAALARATMSRGVFEFNRNDYKAAARAFEGAVTAYRQAELPVRAAEAEKAWGDAELALGRFDDAEAHWRHAISVTRAAGSRAIAINTENSLGAALLLRDDYKTAEKVLRSAVAEARELDDAVLLDPLFNLASVLANSGSVTDSRALAEEALSIARSRRESSSETKAAVLIADADFQLGAIDSAERLCVELVTAIRRRDAQSVELFEPLYILSQLREVRGRLGDSLRDASEAVEIAGRLGQPYYQAYAHLRRARVDVALGGSGEQDLAAVDRLVGQAGSDLDPLKPGAELVRAAASVARGSWKEGEDHLVIARKQLDSDDVLMPMQAAILGCEAEQAAGNTERALAHCRTAIERPRAMASDRAAARAAHARALSSAGRPAEAAREARRALEEARSMEARWIAVSAVTVLLSLSEAPPDPEALRKEGLTAFEALIDSVPAARREQFLTRKDISTYRRILDDPGGPS